MNVQMALGVREGKLVITTACGCEVAERSVESLLLEAMKRDGDTEVMGAVSRLCSRSLALRHIAKGGNRAD